MLTCRGDFSLSFQYITAGRYKKYPIQNTQAGAVTKSGQAPGYRPLGGERTKELNTGENGGASVQEEED